MSLAKPTTVPLSPVAAIETESAPLYLPVYYVDDKSHFIFAFFFGLVLRGSKMIVE